MPAHRLAIPFASSLRLTGSKLARLPSRLLHFSALARSRRALTRLDDHLLRDLGLTRAEANTEAKRRDWDAPSHWKG